MKTLIDHHTMRNFILGIFIILLGACSQATKVKDTPVVERSVETLQATPIVVEPSKTATTTKSSTPVTLQTSTPTPVSTLTPLPVVSKGKQWETILGNMSDNGGCELPCWWGVEPGKTDWGIAVQQFDALANQSPTNSGEYGPSQQQKGYLISDDKRRISWLMNEYHDKVSEIWISTDLKEQFGISTIIKKVGLPEQLLITTFRDLPGYPKYEPFLPFSVVLNYRSKHMIVWYQMEGQKVGENIMACSKKYNAYIFLWAEGFTADDIENYYLNLAGGSELDGKKNLKPLEEVTTLDKEKFALLFDQNKDACIQTPVNNW